MPSDSKMDSSVSESSSTDSTFDERRDSPRVPARFWVREGAGAFVEREGNLALGGAFWRAPAHPESLEVEVRLRVPRFGEELRVAGKVIGTSPQGKQVGLHVKFEELDVQVELALAQFIEGRYRLLDH